MKLTNKNRPVLIRLIVLGALAGTMLWALAEQLSRAAGLPFDLSIGPVGFDLHVLAIWVRVNPGTFLGVTGGALFFRSL